MIGLPESDTGAGSMGSARYTVRALAKQFGDPGSPDLAAVTSHVRRRIRAVSNSLGRLDDCLATVVRTSGPRPGGAGVDALLAADEPELRRQVEASFKAYQHDMMRLRSAMIRALVDTEGMTTTAAADHLGISRPMAVRLYRAS